MTFPQWLDPTPITREFIGAFSGVPVREVSQAHEFREARLESDALQKQELDAAQIEKKRRMREGSLKAAAKKKARVAAEAAAMGVSIIERKKIKHREAAKRRYAKLKGINLRYYANRSTALGSNGLRVGGAGEESSSPGGRP